MLLTLSTKNQN